MYIRALSEHAQCKGPRTDHPSARMCVSAPALRLKCVFRAARHTLKHKEAVNGCQVVTLVKKHPEEPGWRFGVLRQGGGGARREIE